MDELVVAVVVVVVKKDVAEGREAVASFINPQIPLVTYKKKLILHKNKPVI